MTKESNAIRSHLTCVISFLHDNVDSDSTPIERRITVMAAEIASLTTSMGALAGISFDETLLALKKAVAMYEGELHPGNTSAAKNKPKSKVNWGD